MIKLVYDGYGYGISCLLHGNPTHSIFQNRKKSAESYFLFHKYNMALMGISNFADLAV